MRFKTAPTQVKNFDAESGVFEAYVAVFDNVDSYGDMMRKGSFERTLADWRAKSAPIPVLWSHRTDDPDMNIGHVLEAKETDRGLWVKAQLDMEAPKAQTVYRLMKAGRVREFSFAYEVTDGGLETKDGKEFFEIRAVNLYEVGPTPIGANPATELLDVKAHADEIERAVKAGRVLSAKNEQAVRSVIEKLESSAVALKAVLPEQAGEEVQEQTSEEREPSSDKSSEPTMPAASSVVLALIETTTIEGEVA